MCLNTICPDIHVALRRALQDFAGMGVGAWTVRLFGTMASVLIVSSSAQAGGAIRDGLDTIVINDNHTPRRRRRPRHRDHWLRAATGQWQPEGPDGPALTIEAFGEEGAGADRAGPAHPGHGRRRRSSCRFATIWTRRCACTASARVTAPPVPRSTCRRREHARRAVRQRPGGHLSLLGHEHRRAGAVPGAGRRADRRSAERRGRPRPDLRDHRVDQPDPRQLGEIVTADEPSERLRRRCSRDSPSSSTVCRGRRPNASTYRRGDVVRWRVINLSSQTHPMHLHGFYFEVTALGDGRRDDRSAMRHGGDGW